MSFSYRMGRSTVSEIVRETCKAIWSVLQPIYVKPPSCEQDWKNISKQFEQLWNFPHCIGRFYCDHRLNKVRYRIVVNDLFNNYYYNYQHLQNHYYCLLLELHVNLLQ